MAFFPPTKYLFASSAALKILNIIQFVGGCFDQIWPHHTSSTASLERGSLNLWFCRAQAKNKLRQKTYTTKTVGFNWADNSLSYTLMFSHWLKAHNKTILRNEQLVVSKQISAFFKSHQNASLEPIIPNYPLDMNKISLSNKAQGK